VLKQLFNEKQTKPQPQFTIESGSHRHLALKSGNVELSDDLQSGSDEIKANSNGTVTKSIEGLKKLSNENQSNVDYVYESDLESGDLIENNVVIISNFTWHVACLTVQNSLSEILDISKTFGNRFF